MIKNFLKKNKLSREDLTQAQPNTFTDISLRDEKLIKEMAEQVVKEAAFHVNPMANAETRTGLEPRYYLKLEMKAYLRAFQRKHQIHLSEIAEKDKETPEETSLVQYIHRILVDLVEPHFEGGEGKHKIHAKTYIRYVGPPEVSAKIPECIEKALIAYRTHAPLGRVQDMVVPSEDSTE